MKHSQEILDRLYAITNRRPATVIRHLLKHDYITTEELREKYGYRHPPRAIRDVRERGINIITCKMKMSDGRTIGAYKFGDPVFSDNATLKISGRTSLSKALKKALVDKYGAKCFIYYQSMDEHTLQVDHRIPYEIGGEKDETDIDCFMLISPSANRLKSWTCEHCPNWSRKDISCCEHCFWAYPENYTRICGKERRQIIITFTENEIKDYDKLVSLVGLDKAEVTIKALISNFVKPQDNK